MKKQMIGVLTAAACSVLAAAKPAMFWGNTATSWKNCLTGIVEGAQAKTLEAPVYPAVKLAIFSQVGGVPKRFTPEEVTAMASFVERGGIVIVDQGSTEIFPKGKNMFDLSAGEPVLGAAAYNYDAPKSEATALAKKLFGDAVLNPYTAAGRRPGLGKLSDMQIIFGSKSVADLGISQIGKGAVIYSSSRPQQGTEYSAMLAKLVKILLDEKQKNEFFPEKAKRYSALLWGNNTNSWARSISEVAKGKKVSSLTVPVYPDVRFAVYSQIGPVGRKRFTVEEVEALRKFVEMGGIVIVDYSTTGIFPAGKNGFDLSAGEQVLGAAAYNYGAPKSEATALAKKLFGDAVLNPYAAAGRRPGLGKVSRMQILFGSKAVVDLGVNRIGKGAVIYSSMSPKSGSEYNALILKLVKILMNEKELKINFPLPENNSAAVVNGEKFHLAIAGGGLAKAQDFLQSKLSAMLVKKSFIPVDEYHQIVIHAGETPYVKSLNLDRSRLHPFGYYMFFRDGKNIVLIGKTNAGTMYAVNDFLKRFAGYRKFASGELYEITPKQAALKLPVSFDFKEEPDINSYILVWSGNNDFGRNNRLNCMATHALDRMVPPKQYAKSHPEYFPVINGERKKINPDGKNSPWNPCVSHDDLPKLVAEYADRHFKKSPDTLGLPMGVNDGGGDCQCEKCTAVFKRHGNQYVEFYNLAAKVLAEKYPEKLLAFIAYSRVATKAPEKLKLEPNILVEVCGIGSSAFEQMKAWKAAGAKHFGLYDYIYAMNTSFIVPRYYPHLMAGLWRKAYKEYNLESMWMEYYPAATVFEAPRQYVLDELAWNMNADVDALLDDYFKSMYGEAAGKVRKFFDILEETYTHTANPDFPMFGYKSARQMEHYTFANLEKLDSALAEAKRAAVSPDTKKRISALEKLYGFCRYNIVSYVCGKELCDIKKIASKKDCDRVVALAVRGYQAVADAGAYTIPPEEEKLIFPGKTKLNALKNASTLKPLPLLEGKVDAALAKVTAYLQEKKSNVKEYYTAALKQSKDPGFRAALMTQVYLQKKSGLKNLVRNPSFEEGRENTDFAPVVSDHVAWKSVPGWATWTFPNSVTKFFLNTVAHSGKYSGAIGERQIGGNLINYVTVKERCRYRLRFWVRRNRGDDGFGCGSADIRFQRNGKWLDNGAAVTVAYPPECENKWIQLETSFTAPSGGDSTALLLFSAPPQTDGVWTAIDDVSLEKIYEPEEKKK